MHAPTALYAIAEIRAIERSALAVLPSFTLMRRAGEAATECALALLGAAARERRVLALAGPGNNGGDALVAAGCLAQAGVQVTVLHFADAGRLPDDAAQALRQAQAGAVRFGDPADSLKVAQSEHWDLVIDGLFGIGLRRAIAPPLRELVEAINRLPCPVLALDVPSGLDADTGNIVGENGVAIRADDTLSFIADKPGLHTGSGRDHAGRVRVADLGIEAHHFPPQHARLGNPALFADRLRPRPQNSHKGSYGDAIVVGGAHGMTGATILAARAAARCGAGRVFAAFVADPPAYDPVQPELMCRHAADLDFSHGALVVGPGLGTSGAARGLLVRALAADAPLVLDADALNMIGPDAELRATLAARRHPALITPHPLEAARLLRSTVAQVQADRMAAARRLAREFNAVAILKGSGSVIARADGEIAINASGNPALATAGTGDVLAGVCGALLAQSWPVWEAALAATWLHGHAADLLVEQGTGPAGLTAHELIDPIRTALNRLTGEHARERRAAGD